MLLKFIFGIGIVAFTSFCGYLLAKKYRKRKLFLQQFKEFNERFLSEVTYFRRPIKAFVSSYAYKGEFDSFLKIFFEQLEIGQAQVRSFDFKSEFPFLREEERLTVENYFLMLGKGDSSSQKGYFASIKERLTAQCSAAEIDCKKYGDLYIKLGFLCGLLILILMI
ncbi:MAG: stage III sporulation protein AB [Clostridia bacterium]|nr:stage III sporulation protein AB [Clostridia bacterium]